MLTGVDAITGQPLVGIDHVCQSIRDILQTPLGGRVMRPEYGSNIPRMVDQPVTPGWIASVQSEAARAIARWEPRVRVHRARLLSLVDGIPVFTFDVDYDGERRLIEV